jgi:hypothetical protein
MDDQLDIDAEVLFRFVGHKFDNNPMAPVLFKDVITASDRSDGHIFGAGFSPPDTCHAYWFHGFQFVCDKFGKIGVVRTPFHSSPFNSPFPTSPLACLYR